MIRSELGKIEEEKREYEEDNKSSSYNKKSNIINKEILLPQEGFPSLDDSCLMLYYNSKDKEIEENDEDELHDLKEKFKEILSKKEYESGEDYIIYGIKLSLVHIKHKIIPGIIICTNETSLHFFSLSVKKKIEFEIPLTSITDIEIGKSNEKFRKLIIPIPDEYCLVIHYHDNLKSVSLIFQNKISIEYFIIGVISLLQKIKNEITFYDTDLITLKRIWKDFDLEKKKFLNLDSFSLFLKKINFDYGNKKTIDIFNTIDIRKENKIYFKDFIDFYERLVTGEEFKEVFQKYSKKVNPDSNVRVITIKGLIDFYEKEQNEIITQDEALIILSKYSKKVKKLMKLKKIKNIQNFSKFQINNPIFKPNDSNSKINDESESMVKDYENHSFDKENKEYNKNNELNNINDLNNSTLFLKFREFVNLIVDRNNKIIDKNIIAQNDNMNYPLTDYYCYSSHNTYLTDSQIIGNVSLEMYTYTLKNGCRFIDLDTFDGRDGDKNEPIITHWHFPVGYLLFKDVLITIKNNAFIKNDYPLILSLENHCSAGAQEKMEKYFVEILGKSNLYIIDPQNPPLKYPSPKSLKKKFIIKNKRTRIYGNIEEMRMKINNEFNIDSYNSLLHKSFSLADENINTINNELYNKKNLLLNDISHNVIDEKEENNATDIDGLSNCDEIDEGNTLNSVNQLIYNNKYSFIDYINNHIDLKNKKTHFEFQILNEKQVITKKNYRNIEKNEIQNQKKIIQHNKSFNIENRNSSLRNSLKKLNDNFNAKIENEEALNIIKKIEVVKSSDLAHPSKTKIFTIDKLADILGIIGIKFYFEIFFPDKFLPWECISIAENTLKKYCATLENKYNIITFTQHSFLKIYPDTSRTNSSNQDPILCWALGCQFAALNVQKTDDINILINKMFFKINGGSKCGYVLKPERFRLFNKEKFNKEILNRKFTIKFSVISGFHIHLCCHSKHAISSVFVEVSLRTSDAYYENKHTNKILQTNLVNKNFLHPVFQDNSISFDIYDIDLSFIVVIVYSFKREHILARSIIPVKILKTGYRVLELYDKDCSKIDDTYLIVKTSKIYI